MADGVVGLQGECAVRRGTHVHDVLTADFPAACSTSTCCARVGVIQRLFQTVLNQALRFTQWYTARC